jgi:hypothetical protein
MEKNFQRDNYNNSPSLHNLRNRRVQQITSNKIAPLIPTHSYVSSIASTSTSFNDQIKEAEPSKTVFSIFKKDCTYFFPDMIMKSMAKEGLGYAQCSMLLFYVSKQAWSNLNRD